jgi:hypothetical protein
MLIPVGKGIELDVDVNRFNNEVRDHIWKIGLRNLIMDAHASATAKAFPDTYLAKSREMAEKKLAALYAGVVRTQSAGNGVARPADPVAMVILRLARKQVQKDKAKELAAVAKEQRLAVLNKFATEYASAHDAALRPRAMKIVALENDDEPVAPAKAAPAKPAKRK